MTEVFYMWKEVLTDPDDVGLANPRTRLINPHGDPTVYEFPIDFQFNNIRAAIDWRDEEIEVAIDTNDDDYLAEMQRWVLTKVTLEPVDDVATRWKDVATRILAEREDRKS